jgi:DNA-binding FrmR family transcriptional regulator
MSRTRDCAPAKKRRVRQPQKKALLQRLNRIAGQAQGIARMIEEDRYCVDVLVQISAARAALDQVAMQIVEDHTRGCVSRAIQAGQGDEAIAELMEVVRKWAK